VETRLWWQIINRVNFSLINLHKQAAHGNGKFLCVYMHEDFI